jgi:broad specificity phosphatase PhoE
MAQRSRQNRESIPGYDDRPTHQDRSRQHRQVRHAAHQLLATADDLDEVALPEIRKDRFHELTEDVPEVANRRFRVWKTKFWKRRESYRRMRESLDARWQEVTAEPDEAW